MKIIDKEFDLFISEQEINTLLDQLAIQIEETYTDKELVIVGVLNGSFMFVSDLVKRLRLDLDIIFLKYKSYQGLESQEIKVLLELEDDIEDKHVLVLEDIIDTGKTIVRIAQDLNEHNPASLKYATLFLKPATYHYEIPLSFVGKEIPNDFIIGYGMDYNGKGRNLCDVYRLK